MIGRAVAVIAVAVGCGPTSHPADGVDWSKLPVVKATGTEGGHKFTIDLVPGRWEGKDVRPETVPPAAVGSGVVFMVGDIALDLTIIANIRHETLDQFVAEETTKQWLRKDPLPDGFVASRENIYKNDYLVEVQRPELICSARITRWKSESSTSVVDKVPWVEKMCLSVSVVP